MGIEDYMLLKMAKERIDKLGELAGYTRRSWTGL